MSDSALGESPAVAGPVQDKEHSSGARHRDVSVTPVAAEPFWEGLERFGSATALIHACSGATLSYAQLAAQVSQRAVAFRGTAKGLVLMPLNNNVADIIIYLAALISGHAVCLYGDRTPDGVLRQFFQDYRPEFTVGRATRIAGIDALAERREEDAVAYWRHPHQSGIDPALGLLLTTSGTTGSAKFVRLSWNALGAGAVQVRKALGIQAGDTAITSLPLAHVYGLSVLHSHLSAGATIVVEDRPVMDKAFWHSVARHGVGMIAGVPWTYQFLKAGNFDFPHATRLRCMTVSGGAMAPGLRAWLEDMCARLDIRLFYMYGATEACGRMAVLPPEMIQAKPLSVGMPVPGGAIAVKPDGGLIFSGLNVMMGYAARREDLARGDDHGGVFETDDFGRVDADGYVFVEGRRSRLAKVYGVRVNLDDIQAYCNDRGIEVAVTKAEDDSIFLAVEIADSDRMRNSSAVLAGYFGIPEMAVKLVKVDRLARSASGKPLAFQA